MKIYFIGTVEFSKHILQTLIDRKANIVGVSCKKSSVFNNDFVDLGPLCLSNHIPYFYVDNINSEESILTIKKNNPDVIFCIGWSSLLNNDILTLSPKGVVGYHPAALPQNRGRHPLIWALVLGLPETASTFFLMNEKADAGNILSQEKIEISYNDDVAVLYQKAITVAKKQIIKVISLLESNNTGVKQDMSLSNKWRKRTKSDGQIDFRMSSLAIYNLVRGLTKPYLGAHLLYNQKEIKVWRVKEYHFNKNNIEPGKVLMTNANSIVVKTYDNAIELIEHEFITLPKAGEYII
jgi:methionyl-tRNA formyltransferase